MSQSDMPMLLAWIANAQTFSAWEEVRELVSTKPERAWTLIIDMVRLAPSDLTLSAIAAGPLEDLLSYRPQEFVPEAVRRARADARFQRCLSGVWGLEGTFAAAVQRALGKRVTKTESVDGSISRSRAYMIARWFEHHHTMWAPSYMNEMASNDPARAWKLVPPLIELAREADDREIFHEIDVHFFDRIVEAADDELLRVIANNARSSPHVEEWIVARRTYGRNSDARTRLLNMYDDK